MHDSQRRPRILLVTRNLPPLIGGMERLNWHIAQVLAELAEVRCIAPVGSAAMAPHGVKVTEVPLKPLWKFLWNARRSAHRLARSWRPDLIVAGSGLSALLVRSAARQCAARTAVYVHGLDLAVTHSIYRYVWLPAIRAMDHVVANSRATAGLAHRIGVSPSRLGIVPPGVHMPSISEKKLGACAASEFRQRHGLGDRPLLLSVGRLSARKGLLEFVVHSMPHIVAAQPDVVLAVVGDAPKDALYAEAQTPDDIIAAASGLGLCQHLRFLGPITDDELLRALYTAANVHIFPVREIPGDPEGFGMVAVEAAAHGLPTVAFATGGVVDAVAEDRSGYLVKSGDYHALANAVLRVLHRRGAMGADCVAFAGQFAWPIFAQKLAAELFLNTPEAPHLDA